MNKQTELAKCYTTAQSELSEICKIIITTSETKSWLYFSLIREYAYFSRDFLKNKKDLSHQSELAGLRPLPRLTLAHDWS